jgi:putative PIN family toxin of toxin-antitoxin system
MPRPSVVLDTNVVVSAHLKQDGLERFVLDLALSGFIRMFISDEIFEEYSGVQCRPRLGISQPLARNSLNLIKQAASNVRPKLVVDRSCDPDDNKFLECAAEASADYLVTGNKRHFPKRWRATRVVNAREFLQELIPALKS